MSNLSKFVLFLIIGSIIFTISFLAISFLFWLVCLGFEIEFTWLKSLGVWASVAILSFAFKQ